MQVENGHSHFNIPTATSIRNVPFISINHKSEYSIGAFPSLDADWRLTKSKGVIPEQGGAGRWAQ